MLSDPEHRVDEIRDSGRVKDGRIGTAASSNNATASGRDERGYEEEH